jgi:hypothetical protein
MSPQLNQDTAAAHSSSCTQTTAAASRFTEQPTDTQNFNINPLLLSLSLQQVQQPAEPPAVGHGHLQLLLV